jgi:hypothetical protein
MWLRAFYLVFGANWLLTSGQAATIVAGGMMDLDIEMVSDDGVFMVLYSDISNHGAMTATMGQVGAFETR